MKFTLVTLGIAILLLLGGCFNEVSDDQPGLNKTEFPLVDKQIYEDLTHKDEVRVIVTLKNFSVELQSKVINSLSEEEFKQTNNGSGWFAGTITKKGLDKITSDPRVERVYLPEPLRIQND